MNKELIRQCAKNSAEREAIERYHARAVAPLVEAVGCIAAPDEASMTGWSDECIRGWAYAAARIARETIAPFQQDAPALPEPSEADGDDAGKLFQALRDQSWDLRCFDMPTGGDDADIGWRVVGHWMAEPHERTVAEVCADDPAAAVRAALAAAGGE